MKNGGVATKGRRRASAAVMAGLREMLSGDTLREVIELQDHGEVVLTVVGNADGGDVNQPHDDKRDAWTNATEPLEYDRPHRARLYVPGGMLFNAPAAGDTAHMLRPKSRFGTNSPGFGLLIPDGGNGSGSFLPDWWGDNDAGLYVQGKKLHLESKDKDVEVKAGGNVSVDGQEIDLGGDTHPLPTFDTFETDLSNFLTLLLTVLGAGTQGSPVAQTLTALAGALAQLQTFIANLGSGVYHSQKVKNG